MGQIWPAGHSLTLWGIWSEKVFSAVFVYTWSKVAHLFLSHLSLSCRPASPHLSLNRDWPTPKPTRLASSVPTCPATSSRTAWSISCLSSPPASVCSPSVASRAPTTSMPAASTATGQQRTFSFFFILFSFSFLFFFYPRAELQSRS